MITINQKIVAVNQLNAMKPSRQKLKILQWMGKSKKVYPFATIGELDFELEMRLRIMRAAVLMNKSNPGFATFATTRCNEKYWYLDNRGAIILKPNVLPHTALNDIFINGKKYAFECATAMLIIFYKAVLDSIDTAIFNRLFAGLKLYDWQYDADLDLKIFNSTDFLPGDCLYFKNPDVDPKTIHWQGENAILLDRNLYFAHGIGIVPGKFIIDFLNTKRKKNAKREAYLTDVVAIPNFRYLSQFRCLDDRGVFRLQEICHPANLIVSEIGTKTYLL
ncbi:protein-glutamine gamma-glutamyltransferase [Neobacillus sp. YIM B06451]|uniref:protein-glutamine gamma-glutamyltransferase n=1 Tax=Neobacillus sp. YIM B06451 TaxID=3070994 RepID=UPI00292FC336|nr:protein-glutamine gamma-glutamyltransferase [Neobacillus sp. YIM B06451]